MGNELQGEYEGNGYLVVVHEEMEHEAMVHGVKGHEAKVQEVMEHVGEELDSVVKEWVAVQQ